MTMACCNYQTSVIHPITIQKVNDTLYSAWLFYFMNISIEPCRLFFCFVIRTCIKTRHSKVICHSINNHLTSPLSFQSLLACNRVRHRRLKFARVLACRFNRPCQCFFLLVGHKTKNPTNVIDPNIAIKLTNSAAAVQNIFISSTMSQFVKPFDFGCQTGKSLRLTDIVILVPVPISVDASFKSCWCLTDDVGDNPHAFGAFKDFVICRCHFRLSPFSPSFNTSL